MVANISFMSEMPEQNPKPRIQDHPEFAAHEASCIGLTPTQVINTFKTKLKSRRESESKMGVVTGGSKRRSFRPVRVPQSPVVDPIQRAMDRLMNGLD
jgi:hypothetical protein